LRFEKDLSSDQIKVVKYKFLESETG